MRARRECVRHPVKLRVADTAVIRLMRVISSTHDKLPYSPAAAQLTHARFSHVITLSDILRYAVLPGVLRDIRQR